MELSFGTLTGQIGVSRSTLDPWIAGPQSKSLDEERKTLQAELAAVEDDVGAVAIHPAMAQYLTSAEGLAEGLRDHAQAADERGSVVEDFRSLVATGSMNAKLEAMVTAAPTICGGHWASGDGRTTARS